MHASQLAPSLLVLSGAWLAAAIPFFSALAPAAPQAGSQTNVLFVILDDVGSDQLAWSNPAGIALPATPTMNSLVQQGVNFTNCWSMPECSPSRVCFFTGRFPTRTGVGSPLTPSTLPQSQCSPFEATTPRLLAEAGYATALFGKFHLAQNENNPFGIHAPSSVGFTHFNGTLLGGPAAIDETVAGQITDKGAIASCGYPVTSTGPAICACAFQDGRCEEGIDAVECLAAGGVPLTAADGTPITTCDADAAARINWTNTNGNYVWNRTINQGATATQELPTRVNADFDQAEHAIAFINAQQALATPWMCTLSFTGDHDPWQQPTAAALPPDAQWPSALTYACDVQPGVDHAGPQQRLLSDWTIEAMDTQIRRVLLTTGLAQLSSTGLHITAPDTLIVVIGDNGSFLTTVKAPYNPTRSKATAYQTGVVVPLVMAGGPVASPGRSVDAMVNVVDLFQLWGEMAGINVHNAVPPGRQLDSRPMRPYLVNAAQPPLRQFNFTEYVEPILDTICYPCLIPAGGSSTICTDTFLASEQFCTSQNGVWYGPGTTYPDGVQSDCCALWDSLGEPSTMGLIYAGQQAITNGRWKLIHNTMPDCTIPGTMEWEFYDLAHCFAAEQLGGRGVDDPQFNLLATGEPLTAQEQAEYNELLGALNALNADMAPCVGDVTMNGVVNGQDLAAMFAFWGLPSVADLNNDGITDGADLSILISAWGVCHEPN